jgi:hypothetical protein
VTSGKALHLGVKLDCSLHLVIDRFNGRGDVVHRFRQFIDLAVLVARITIVVVIFLDSAFKWNPGSTVISPSQNLYQVLHKPDFQYLLERVLVVALEHYYPTEVYNCTIARPTDCRHVRLRFIVPRKYVLRVLCDIVLEYPYYSSRERVCKYFF